MTKPDAHGRAAGAGPAPAAHSHPRDRLFLDTTSTMRFLRPAARLVAALSSLAPASLTAQGTPATGARGAVAFVDVSVIPMTGSGPLVLLDADPLANVDNLERRAGVMVHGRWVPADEIRRGLEQIASRNAAP
jgi:hypothetical protein